MPATPGHQAVVRYVAEATPGTTPANPALLLFSREVTRFSFGTDKNLQESWDIQDVDPEELFSAENSYTAEVEGHVYDVSKVLDFAERLANGNKSSYTLEFIPDQDATTPHYFRGTGWTPKTVKLASGVGKPWVFTITFDGGKWADPVTVDPGIGTGSRQLKSALSALPLRTFASGAITLDAAAMAVIMDDFEVTIEDVFESHLTTGSADPVAAAAVIGQRTIKGSASVSADDGFSAAYLRTKNFAASTIVIPFGVAGQPKLTLTGVRWPVFEGESAVETDLIMVDQEFQATAWAEGVV